AVFADFCDAVGDKFDVRTIERWIVIVRNKDAFAAELIVGSERGAELGILDPAGEMAKSDFFGFPSNGHCPQEAEDAKFLTPENKLAQNPSGKRKGAKAALPFFAESEIHARHNPGRCALKKRELADQR